MDRHPYPDTRESSGELLRIVLPMLSKHPAGFTPISYAIRYEHAAGTNIKRQYRVARMGGQEFLVFLPDTPIDGASKHAGTLRATVAA